MFELCCFSCGLDGSSRSISSSSNGGGVSSSSSSSNGGGSSSAVDGCIEALFYMALQLQPAHLPQLAACPGVTATLSVQHNAIVLLRSVPLLLAQLSCMLH